MLQGHTDFCVLNFECQPGIDSPVAGCHHRSNSLTPHPPVGGNERSREGGWRTSGIPGGPAPSIQVSVSRKPPVWKPRASPTPAKQRRSLSAPSTSLYGPHSPQSKAATELTSQDGGNRRSSNLPNCVPSPSPCQPSQKASILLGEPSCPGSRGEASSQGPGADRQWGPLFAATFKAHKLLI